MAKTATILISAVLVLAACTNTNQTQLPEADFFVRPEQRFRLRVGDTAGVVISTAVVLVRFGGVFSDSRCPEGVNCVQAGAAVCFFSVQTTLSVQEVEIAVPPGGGVEREVEEVTLRIEEVLPAAQEEVTIDPVSYEVTMTVAQTGDPLEPPS